MFRFESPQYLFFLIVIPIVFLIRFVSDYGRRRKIRMFGDANLVQTLMPDVSPKRRCVKFLVFTLSFAMAIVMLARPQMGVKISKENRNGIETIICLDISNSMLARDVVPSRLDKAKMLVENLVDKFVNDKIGIVVFAGDAFVQLPITSDYVSAKMFLQDISPNLIADQGTDIGRAIKLASASFTQQSSIGKAIIVITDGENHEGGAVEAAEKAREKGINVFIMAIGSNKGAPVPLGNGEYLKDKNGSTVISSVNESMCRQIAQAGSGTYIHVDNSNDAQDKLDEELSKLQKGKTEGIAYSEYNEQFVAVAILVFILLIVDVCILEAKNERLKKIHLFKIIDK